MLKNFEFKKFKYIFSLFISIAIMMTLSSLLSIIDSAMVTNYNKFGATAITIASQVNWIVGPTYFAIMTGIGIYTVQYFARGENSKIKETSSIAFVMMLPITLITFLVLEFNPDILIGAYTQDKEIYNLSLQFLKIYNYSLLFLPFESFFIYQYRAIKMPKIPMMTGIGQALLNVILNYLLIFGNLGFPEMGIEGAALSTLISRIVFTSINIILANHLKVPIALKLSNFYYIKKNKLIEVVKNTMPLIIVEFGFGIGNIIYTIFYSHTDVNQFNLFNISRNISYTLNSLVMATASVAGIVIGGVIAKGVKKNDINLRKWLDNVFIFIWFASIMIMLLSVFVLPFMISWFDPKSGSFTPSQIKLLKEFLYINGLWMSIRVFSSSFISILKSGNDNKFIIVIDAGVTFLVGIPLTMLALHFTDSILILRLAIIVEVSTKLALGYFRYRQGKWIKRVD